MTGLATAAALLLATVAVQVAVTGTAGAAFPGSNGKIYFAADPAGARHIYSIDPDGTGLTQLTSTDNDDGSPVGSPDGTKVAFTRFLSGQEIFTMNADGTGVTQVTTGSNAFDGPIDWSPDGTKIVYASVDGLRTLNADGTGNTLITSTGSAPAWSPDGTKIAYSASGNIWAVNADGTAPTQLTSSSMFEGQPEWSPNGAKIAYVVSVINSPTPAQIYTMNADGSSQANLSNDSVDAGNPAWSPDGTRIAYLSGDFPPDISVMNADGTAKTPLFGFPSVGERGLNWAPGTAPVTADLRVAVTAQPHLGILVPYLTYTLTAHNTGPAGVTAATLTATLPPGASATNLSAGCTTGPGTVTCTYGAIANGASASKSFRVPLHLLSLGHVSVSGTRTSSTPTDPNPANDTATATCTVISILLATCP